MKRPSIFPCVLSHERVFCSQDLRKDKDRLVIVKKHLMSGRYLS